MQLLLNDPEISSFSGKFPNSCMAESLPHTNLEYFRNRGKGLFFG